MRVPCVRDTGQFGRDLGHQRNQKRKTLDPINIAVWGIVAAAVPAYWAGLSWCVSALINFASVS